MNSVCNVEYNIALIINTKETDIDRRRIYPGERHIDRVPTPPLSDFDCNIPTTKNDKNGSN